MQGGLQALAGPWWVYEVMNVGIQVDKSKAV